MPLTTIRIIPENTAIEMDHGAVYLAGYFSRRALGSRIAVLPQDQIDTLTAMQQKGLKRIFSQVRGLNYAENPRIADTRESIDLFRVDAVRHEWDDKRKLWSPMLSKIRTGMFMQVWKMGVSWKRLLSGLMHLNAPSRKISSQQLGKLRDGTRLISCKIP